MASADSEAAHRFGPFSIRDWKLIEPALSAKGIEPMLVEEAQSLWLELKASDLALLGGELESYGISQASLEEPDFDTQDYLCPRCRFSMTEPGNCPKHHVPLLEYSDYVNRKQTYDGQVSKVFGRVALVGIVLYFIYLAVRGML